VPRLELGPVGIATGLDSSPASLEAAALVEELGFSTLWLNGGPLPGLRTIADVVRATRTIRVAAGILSVDKYDAAAVASLYDELEAEQPGRFVVGLGGAHGAKPVATISSYLDRLDSVPADARVLAALGPRMLRLARDRSAGAYPVLITPEYAAKARSLLGDGPLLAVQQMVVLETDPARAREIARGTLGFLGRVPGYAGNFRRMGFTGDEIDRVDDRLVDGLVAWGDAAAIEARVTALRDAGADHVALGLLTGTPGAQPLDEWRALAEALVE
jgi:probable F420-dependent oxidoreductase